MKIKAGEEWSFEKIDNIYTIIKDIVDKKYGLNYYSNQLEIISSEQMLDACSSAGLPLFYTHWSFGQQFVKELESYKRGKMGLAYEIIINCDPAIAYLMEENTMLMQALVISHACVDGDTEYLSPTGWKKISEYKEGKIGQYNKNGTMEFVTPLNYVVNDCDEMNEFKNSRVHQRLTDDHRVVYKSHENDNLKIRPFHEIKKMHKEKTRGFHGKFINVFTPKIETSLNMSDDEIRLQVAMIADGNKQGKKIRFHLKKDRKIERLEMLLQKEKIKYDKHETYGGRFKIVFNYNVDNIDTFDDSFYSASLRQLLIISKEALLWDGHRGKQNSFFSTSKKSADFIQYVFSATGYRAPMKKFIDRRNNFVRKPLYTVTKNPDTTSGISGGRNDPCEITKYKTTDGKSYCFNVPSEMLILRCQDYIFITGNCFGHNHFFKNNYLFKQWTDADGIIDYLAFAKKYINECEEKHGVEEVEAVIDAAHSLQRYGVDKYKHPEKISAAKEEKLRREREKYIQSQLNDIWRTIPTKETVIKEQENRFPSEPHENILYFIEKNAPRLEDWKREIIRIIRKISQYFYPQGQTQVINEGTATFFHHKLIHDLYNENIIDDGAMLEFYVSHTGVINQRGYDNQYFNGINPYALGFAMFQDIERISMNPTEEDKLWFKNQEWVGNGDWLKNIKWVIENFKDESFIKQFISPKIIRDFRFFVIHDDEKDPKLLISGIHNEQGYKIVREALSNQYNIGYNTPDIQIYNVDRWGDRSLTLRHYMVNKRSLDQESTIDTLRFISFLWGYDVRLESVDTEENVRAIYDIVEDETILDIFLEDDE